MEFKVFKLTQEFYSVCNWRDYKIPLSDQRPGLLLVFEDTKYSDALCCIPISKDDDKNQKYKNLLQKKPNNVHPINMNQYDNYLLIQNMFYVKKEFIGAPFTVKGIQIEIKNTTSRQEILKKVSAIDALIKAGKLPYFVPREEVYEIQVKYLNDNKNHI